MRYIGRVIGVMYNTIPTHEYVRVEWEHYWYPSDYYFRRGVYRVGDWVYCNESSHTIFGKATFQEVVEATRRCTLDK